MVALAVIAGNNLIFPGALLVLGARVHIRSFTVPMAFL